MVEGSSLRQVPTEHGRNEHGRSLIFNPKSEENAKEIAEFLGNLWSYTFTGYNVAEHKIIP